MNWFKRHPLTVLLGIACLLAAFGLGLEYRVLQRFLFSALQPPPISAEAASASEPALATLAELPPIEAFSAFVEQPLFVEGRKPLPEETETVAEAKAEHKPPNLRLTGIIATPEIGQIILVQDPTNKTLRFKPGEVIDGWRVAELKDDQVILERSGKTHILQLIKPRPLQPPPASHRSLPPQGQVPNPFAQAIARQQAMIQQKQE